MTKRKNITMSDEIAKWYEDKAEELGIAQTAVMTIALKQYMEQDKTINVLHNMEQLIIDVQELKNSIPRTE